MSSDIVLSSRSGWLRINGAVRRPDGLWEPADAPKGADFLPFNGEWGYLVLRESDRVRVARLEAWGIAWERELPVAPGEARDLPDPRVDPDGALRAGSWVVSPDGEIAISPLGWGAGVIPGPGGSWLTRDGVQLIPDPDGTVRAIRWVPPGWGFRVAFLWIGREGILAYQRPKLFWIPRPGARAILVVSLDRAPVVAPDGRWIGRDAEDSSHLIMGRGGQVMTVMKAPPSSFHRPLHEGWWISLTRGNQSVPVWVRPDGSVKRVPALGRHLDAGPWRIWPSAAGAMAVRRGGSSLYRLPPLHEPIPEGWALDHEGRLWRLPPDGEPHPVPVEPGSTVLDALLGVVGEEALVRGRREGQTRIIRVGEEGPVGDWPLPEGFPERDYFVRAAGEDILLLSRPRIGRLRSGSRAVWAPGPGVWGFHHPPEIVEIPGGWMISWGNRIWVLPREDLSICRAWAV